MQRKGTNKIQFDGYYGPLRDLIKEYSLDGFDLDIEEQADITIVLKLINSLRTDFGSSFLITMAPVASALASPTGGDLSGFSYFDLDSQAVSSTGEKLVSFYNGQFYSGFGSPATTSTYDKIVSAGWDPERVVMGVIDASNDGSGFVKLSTVQSTITSLRAKYPTFGGVDGWEYFDAGSSDSLTEPWEWVKAIGSSVFGTTTASATTTATASTATKDKGKGGEKTEREELPEHPFDVDAVANLTSRGATHFEAVRALNLTDGDAWLARGLLDRHLKAKLF